MRKFVLLVNFVLFSFILTSTAQVFKIDTAYSATELVTKYLVKTNHNGIIINNIKYSGFSYTKGLFYYNSNYNVLPGYGIVLSTGRVLDALGPNNYTASTENHLKGDKELSMIHKYKKTFDAVIIEFDFMSLTDSIGFIFQFASEEYPEYVNKGVSDIFGFIVTNTTNNHKKNLGKIKSQGDPITIDLINSEKNSNYYISNNYNEKVNHKTNNYSIHENINLFQFDGFTTPIYNGTKLESFVKYRFKIAIADVGDRKFDSWIFLKANSFTSNGDKKELSNNHIKNYLQFLELDSLNIRIDSLGYSIFLPTYFGYNSFSLTNKSKLYLDHIIDLLRYSKNKIIIKGYTDETGTKEHNLILSKQRANAVKNYIISRGVENNKLSAVGMGELKPGKLNSEARKVEIKIIKKAPN